MNPDLKVFQESISDVLRDLCDRRAIHDCFDGKSDLDRKLWAKAADLGWMACAVPEADGGLGLGAPGIDLLHRELGCWLAPGPFLSTLATAQWLAEFADADIKSRYLPAILAGELTVVVPVAMSSAIADEPGNLLRVLGSADAGLAVLPGDEAGSMRLAELSPNEQRLTSVNIWDCTRQVSDLRLEGLRTTAVVQNGDGLIANLCLAIAGDSLGAARSIADQTVDYMKTREQFGRPIGTFQALKHRAADLYAKLAIQDELQNQAVDAKDSGSDAGMWTRLAKAGATDAASFISGDCVQLHGGVGHTWEFDVHMFLKRSRLNQSLVAPNWVLLDEAADLLETAARAGRTTAELSL